jgi:hypothetical protein
MNDTDFPEYGRQCELLTPWRGYHRGTVVGLNGYRFIIEVSSGARIELYEDEILKSATIIQYTIKGRFMSR